MGNYGKKGGTSANAGRTSSTYEAVMPDGTVVRKRSFHVHQDDALVGCFEHNGKWHVSGVTDRVQNWGGQRFIPAKRTK